MRWIMLGLFVLVCAMAQAQGETDKSSAGPGAPEENAGAEPQAPAAPDDLEPEITIRTEGDTVFEEHRLNGRLYMVKVTPKHGVPYYLLDRDGDGQFESRLTDLENDTAVPMWVIKRW